jgi:hypothetical protein
MRKARCGNEVGRNDLGRRQGATTTGTAIRCRNDPGGAIVEVLAPQVGAEEKECLICTAMERAIQYGEGVAREDAGERDGRSIVARDLKYRNSESNLPSPVMRQ